MVPNVIEQVENDERTKDGYWISLTFLVYDDIRKRDPSLVLDNQKLMDHDFAPWNKYHTNVYWIWHDLFYNNCQNSGTLIDS